MKDSDASRNSKSEDGVVSAQGAQASQGPLDAFLRSIKLFFTKDMGLLSVAFFYIGNFYWTIPFWSLFLNMDFLGIEYSFLSGVYSPSIGFTLEFEDSKRLVGLSGIFIGVGEIAGRLTCPIVGLFYNFWFWFIFFRGCYIWDSWFENCSIRSWSYYSDRVSNTGPWLFLNIPQHSR